MTAPQKNLQVLTDHIDALADQQIKASDQFIGANRSATDVASRVFTTHGAVCAATCAALSVADTERNTVGAGLLKRSNDLSAKLSTAAANYANTDYLAGLSISQECRA